MNSDKGIILFAHGARDPEWAEPFRHMRREILRRDAGVSVELAFLEHMSPTLAEAIDQLAARGVTKVRVVLGFMAQGAHLKRDIPALLQAARERHPGLSIVATPALGELEGVIDAIACHALETLQG